MNLKEGKKYCMLPTSFWEKWLVYAVLSERAAPGKAPELILSGIKEKNRYKKLAQGITYPKNVVFVPIKYLYLIYLNRVYNALHKWHSSVPKEEAIIRKVIKYQFAENPKAFSNSISIDIESNLSKFSLFDQNICYELEINEFFFYGFRISDDGFFPEFPEITLCDKFWFREKFEPKFVEIYISRYFKIIKMIERKL